MFDPAVRENDKSARHHTRRLAVHAAPQLGFENLVVSNNLEKARE